MGRRRRSDKSATPSADAVFQPRPLTATLISDITSRPVQLTEIEDRRSYHPLDTFRPAMEIGGTTARPVTVKKSFKPQLPFGLSFGAPKETAICVRRKTRKEVLFAKRHTGAGKRRRNPRKNWYSNIGC